MKRKCNRFSSFVCLRDQIVWNDLKITRKNVLRQTRNFVRGKQCYHFLWNLRRKLCLTHYIATHLR